MHTYIQPRIRTPRIGLSIKVSQIRLTRALGEGRRPDPNVVYLE